MGLVSRKVQSAKLGGKVELEERKTRASISTGYTSGRGTVNISWVWPLHYTVKLHSVNATI